MRTRLVALIVTITGSVTVPSVFQSKGSELHVECDTLSVWEVLVEAIIQTESEGNPNAVGLTKDAGLFQITPIYVKDANRIVGEERYSLQDRFSPDKSHEMFSIVQAHYNPGKNIDKAIRLHNPGAGKWYGDKVKSNMAKISRRYVETNAHATIDKNGNILILKLI